MHAVLSRAAGHARIRLQRTPPLGAQRNGPRLLHLLRALPHALSVDSDPLACTGAAVSDAGWAEFSVARRPPHH